MMNFIRRHWMILSALAIAATAALVVGLVAGLVAPVLPFLVGLTVFGFAPLAFLATMSLPAAAATVAGIAAGVALAGAALFDALYFITRKLDKLLTPKESYMMIGSEPEDKSSCFSNFPCLGGKKDNSADPLFEDDAEEENVSCFSAVRNFFCSSKKSSSTVPTAGDDTELGASGSFKGFGYSSNETEEL